MIQFLNNRKSSLDFANTITILLFVLILILSIVFLSTLWYLLRFITIPFREFHRNLSEIGLNTKIMEAGTTDKNGTALVKSQINAMFYKINNLFSLIDNMNNNYTFTEMLNFINQTFSVYIPYNYIGVALIENDKKRIKAAYGVSDGTIEGLPEKLVGKSVALKETSLLKLLEKGEARIINDLREYTRNKEVKFYNKVIMDAGIKASVTLPLRVMKEPVGVIFFSSSKANVYNESHLKFLKLLVSSIEGSFQQNIFISNLLYSSILALATLAEARDEDTGEHLDRMKVYAKTITELLYNKGDYVEEIDFEFLENIERFSPLHDIGKVGIPDSILLKPGKLTKEEFEIMKEHTTYGAKVLRIAEENIAKYDKHLFGMGIEIAESHQEKWDGSGYPYGKKGLEIPLSARIVAVADVFDALTSKRPYKKAFSFEESFDIILSESGTHFDPVIVTCLNENKRKFLDVYHKLNKSEIMQEMS